MTTNAMSCDGFHDRLMAYLEGETDAATRVAVERHAATCMDCGAVLADVRKISADAAALPPLAPSRDLWSGIAARIEAPVVPIAKPAQRGSAWSRPSVRTALFAASLLAAAGIGYAARRPAAVPRVASLPTDSVPTVVPVVVASTESTPPAPTSAAGARVVRRPVTVPERTAPTGALQAQLAVATLTADYDREIARLRVLIAERRNQMDSSTVAVIEKNMRVIDAAILDSKKAIAADPSSAFLIESLNQSLRTKVELMRTAAALPIRM